MDQPKPHYLKLKQYIVRHIANGDWPPLSRIPSENDLVLKFGVSRMTVNQALRELTHSGVVTRVQGVGTFVAGAKAESAIFEVRSIRDEILARGRNETVFDQWEAQILMRMLLRFTIIPLQAPCDVAH